MREVKFRGKRVDNGEWVEGNLVLIGGAFFIIPFAGILLPDTIFQEMAIEVIPETVGQRIGLKNKNGKEIWEGDIAKNEDGGWTGDLYRIEWHLAGFYWFKFYDAHRKRYIADIFDQAHAPIYYGNSYEVIGSVHDSPELLEAAK